MEAEPGRVDDGIADEQEDGEKGRHVEKEGERGLGQPPADHLSGHSASRMRWPDCRVSTRKRQAQGIGNSCTPHGETPCPWRGVCWGISRRWLAILNDEGGCMRLCSDAWLRDVAENVDRLTIEQLLDLHDLVLGPLWPDTKRRITGAAALTASKGDASSLSLAA